MKNADYLKSSNACSDTQKRSPSFFKIMFQDFKNVLIIPPKFAYSIGGLVKQTVHLCDYNGNSWKAKISVINGHLAFQDGWCDFVRDHSITEGEFVVFRYRGHSKFTVKIWGADACERICFKEKIKKSDIELKRKASIHDCESIHLFKKHRTCEASENKRKFKQFDLMEKVKKENLFRHDMFGKTKYSRKPVICEEKKLPKTIKKDFKHLNTIDMQPASFTSNHGVAPSRVIDEDAMDHVATEDYPETVCAIPSNMVTKEVGNTTSVIGSKLPVLSGSHSLPKKCFKNSMEDVIQLNEAVHKFLVTEDGVCHIFDENLMNEIAPSTSTRKENSAHGKYKEKPQGITLKYHKHHRIMERFAGQSGMHGNKKKAKENDLPILKEKSIQVKLESMKVLSIRLPAKSGRGKLARKMILIRDPYMRSWPVLYVEEIRFIGFVDGWAQFMRANKLKTGDCCKFEEVLASEYTLQVQIT